MAREVVVIGEAIIGVCFSLLVHYMVLRCCLPARWRKELVDNYFGLVQVSRLVLLMFKGLFSFVLVCATSTFMWQYSNTVPIHRLPAQLIDFAELPMLAP